MDRDRNRPRVLVIEDEDAIRTGICDLLAFHGMAPVGVGHGEEGRKEALASEYDLLIVDVMLPGCDGFRITESVRQAKPSQPILLLTAKGGEDDVLRGFAAGCDDYVAKPFSLQLLVARVRALLRRGEPQAEKAHTIDALTFDLAAMQVRGPSGIVELSPRDADVLRLLIARRGTVVTRLELLRDVWGYRRADQVETRAVDMHMVKLRRRLGEIGADEGLIETVRGSGYRLRGGPQ